MKLAWNVKKNTAGSLKNLEREQNRDNVNNRNELIDKSRSHLNYELVPGSRNLTEKTLDLVEQSRANGSRIQKNSVVDLSNIITLSREYADKLGYEGTKYYFSSVVEYFQEEFGKENVTSAIVHLDESKPHMHLHITPINAENGKLQARNVMTRGRVNKIHTELPKFLQERGFDVERGNSREKDGTRKDYVRDINKLKQLTEQEREKFSAFKQKNDVLEKTLDKNKTEIAEISKIRGHKEQEIISVSETLEKEKEALKKALNEKLEYEREMQKLFDQKMALSDENERLRKENAELKSLKDRSSELKKAYFNAETQKETLDKELEVKLDVSRTAFKSSYFPPRVEQEKNRLTGKETGRVIMSQEEHKRLTDVYVKALNYAKAEDRFSDIYDEIIKNLKARNSELKFEKDEVSSELHAEKSKNQVLEFKLTLAEERGNRLADELEQYKPKNKNIRRTRDDFER